MRAWQFRSLITLVIASCWFLQACVTISGPPTGSAARLNEPRIDENATLEAAGKRIPDLHKQTSDISSYLDEVAGIPPDPILIHDQVNDAQAKIFAQAFQSTLSLVKNSQTLLENFKDVASFLNANFEKAEDELKKAVKEYDSQPGVTPIGSRIKNFEQATEKINEETAKYQSEYFASGSKLINPFAHAASWMNDFVSNFASSGQIKVCLDYGIRGTAHVRIDLLSPEGRDCILRPIEEHRRLKAASEGRAAQHKQAAINGLEYIKRTQNTLLTISQFGQTVILTFDKGLTIEKITKREEFDYAFDFRSEIIEAPYSAVWEALKLTLINANHRLWLEDKRRGLFSTNLVSDGSGLSNSIKIYGQIYPIAKFANKTVNWTKIQFKQFVFRERADKQVSPGQIRIKYFPNYDEDIRREKAQRFLQEIKSRLRSLS